MSTEDYINVGNSIGKIAILIVPHMSEGDDYIASEVIFQMRGGSLGKLAPIFVI